MKSPNAATKGFPEFYPVNLSLQISQIYTHWHCWLKFVRKSGTQSKMLNIRLVYLKPSLVSNKMVRKVRYNHIMQPAADGQAEIDELGSVFFTGF